MFKMKWLLGCGLRLEAYNCVSGVWLMVPYIGVFLTSLTVEEVSAAYGAPEVW